MGMAPGKEEGPRGGGTGVGVLVQHRHVIMTAGLGTNSGWSPVGVAWALVEGLGRVRWGVGKGAEIAAWSLALREPMCPVLRAQALAAYNPVSGCEMETPRRRFLGYRSLATTILSPHWPALGTYLVCSSVPTAPPPMAREGEENLVLSSLGIPR